MTERWEEIVAEIENQAEEDGAPSVYVAAMRIAAVEAERDAAQAEREELACKANENVVLRNERDEAREENAKLRAALVELLLYAESQRCLHEDTYRGGAIWEICRQCGRRWADDEGGRTEEPEPKEVLAAREALGQTTTTEGE